MPTVPLAEVKRLREATGAGMMDAKNALTEAEGDFDRAVEVLRIKGAGKAAKRGAERTASNGLVAADGGAMIELACETDFVAKNADFQRLASDIVAAAAAAGLGDVDGLAAAHLPDGKTVAEAIESASAVIGEKLELRRAAYFDGETVIYLHKRDPDLPPQVGVLVEYTGDSSDTARVAAMQVAAMKPQYVTRGEVPADVVENERRIAEATAREEGKPEQALPKIVEGRVNGFYKDAVLVDQASVTEPKRTVGAVLEEAGIGVRRFVRFEVGEA